MVFMKIVSIFIKQLKIYYDVDFLDIFDEFFQTDKNAAILKLIKKLSWQTYSK